MRVGMVIPDRGGFPRVTRNPNIRLEGPVVWQWLTARLFRTADTLVEADARALIDQHGIQAYGVARWRAHQVGTGKLVDDSRPSGHWRAVSRRVARLTGHEVGLDSATRREAEP